MGMSLLLSTFEISGGRTADPGHDEIKTRNEEYEHDGKTMTRKVWRRDQCDLKKTFSSVWSASEGTSRAAFNKLVEGFNADRDPVSNDTRRVFCNYLEYWKHLQTQDDDLTAWLRQKYIGMRLSTRLTTAGTRPRHIYDIIFHTRRPKGYHVLTGLVKSNGNVDKSSDVMQATRSATSIILSKPASTPNSASRTLPISQTPLSSSFLSKASSFTV